jgi:probable aminopeptidase NPEPL1
MISFADLSTVLAQPSVLVLGRKSRLSEAAVRGLVPAAAGLYDALLEELNPGDRGASAHTLLPGDPPRRFTLGALPEACSRHNSPARPHGVTQLASAAHPRKGGFGIVAVLDDVAHALATTCALARAFPTYHLRSRPPTQEPLFVAFVSPDGTAVPTEALAPVLVAVQAAARLSDMPTCELDTERFVTEARAVAERHARVGLEVIEGNALATRGFGGLWSVGRAAVKGPAFVHLSWPGAADTPSSKTVVWVGKGIVYDTGGLSLKAKAGMPGMKGDMAGAAAVLAAFEAAVTLGVPHRLHALLCIAENAVGPHATRPDDVITLYSGRTVEVNNTDAEGRLVLGDGVAYATRHLAPDLLIDIATLTGAQLVATGRRHAAVISNDDAAEAIAVAAGRSSGDLVHPLPYCPEFFRGEFKSEIADMKNSVKNRENAQTSCAAQFIANHLGDYAGPWVHLDIAGPALFLSERASGFGVGLLLDMLERL